MLAGECVVQGGVCLSLAEVESASCLLSRVRIVVNRRWVLAKPEPPIYSPDQAWYMYQTFHRLCLDKITAMGENPIYNVLGAASH